MELKPCALATKYCRFPEFQMLSIIVSPFLAGSMPRGFTCFVLSLFLFYYPHRQNFPKDIVLSCVCDFVLLFFPHGKIFPKDIVLRCVCDFVIRTEWEFRKDIILSCVCNLSFFFFFFFFFFFLVTMITLESLNQSEPNFHTWLLSRKARPRSKIGIAGHM